MDRMKRICGFLAAVPVGVLLLLAQAFSADPALAAFPGANGKIVVVREVGRHLDGVFSVQPDGSALIQVTRTPEGRKFDPAWSPNGKLIAYAAPSFFDSDIFVVNADGSGERRLGLSSPGLDLEPAWSPDGSKIAFVSDRLDGFIHIYAANLDGSDLVRLTGSPDDEDDGVVVLYNFSPAWSPDGTKIAFSRVKRNDDTTFSDDIYLVNPDGTGDVQLTDTPGPASRPEWSPDGAKIAFNACTRNGSRCDVHLVNRDGTDLTNVTAGFAGYPGLIAWSPDGQKLLIYVRGFQISPAYYVINTDGSEPRFVLDAQEEGGDWQPIPFKNASKRCKAFPSGFGRHGACVRAAR
jgi:Tol biopolymer transport system component